MTQAQATPANYDSDGDGLIEIYTLYQLTAVRWDLDGNGSTSNAGYAPAFPLTPGGSVCPSGTTCRGYELMADLDFDENNNGMRDDTYNRGAGWAPIGSDTPANDASRYNAVFDGNGHTISNLFINRATTNDVGLFGALGTQGEVRNIGLENASVKGRKWVGVLVGSNYGAVVRSYATGSVSGGVSGNANAEAPVGGLVGLLFTSARIDTSYAEVEASNISNGVGGLAGQSLGGSITASYATGAVRARGDETFAGGLAGGINANASVDASYSTGAVSHRNNGLLGAAADGATVTNSYFDRQTTGQSQDADYRRTTAELQGPTANTGIYRNWDAAEWDFGTSNQYPVLKVDFNNDGRATWEEFGFQRTPTVSGVAADGGRRNLAVSWNAASRVDGYRVQWKLSSAGNYTDVLEVSGSTTRVMIDDLPADTSYDVRVTATSRAKGPGAPSATVTATTLSDHAIVSATNPSPLTERNLDGAVLTVDLLPDVYDPWAPRLDRAEFTVSGVPGVTIADVTRVSDERMLVTLASDDSDFDEDRRLRVDFYLAHTSIGTITAVTDVTAVVEPPPGRVQNVQVTPGPLSVRVTWDPVDDATGYRLEWSPPAAFGSSFHKQWPWPPWYTIGALLPDTQYTVRVVATKTRAPDGPRSASASATTPAFGARLVRTEPSPLTENNLHGARLTVDVQGVEWERLVEGRYYRSQLGWLNDCSEAKYYDNCYPFIVTRSVVVTGIERVSSSRVVVSLWARNVDLQGNGLWIRFPDDMHTHYYGEDDYIILQVIAPEQTEPIFDPIANMRASVTVTAADPVSVNEGGASASYTVVLDGQPSGDVVIAASSDNGDVTTQPASLTFTRDNWQTPQTVSVRASHDDDAVDDAAVISHAVSGADGYAGIDVASVSVSVTDDDEAGVTVHPTSLNVNEGESTSYTVVLDTQPVSNVVIYVSDGNGVTVQPSSLTFTPDNWQTAQTVTVSGAQDDDTDNETTYVTHSILAEPGSAYVGVLVNPILVSIDDDDELQAEAAQQEPEPEPEPGSVTVSASSLGVREGDDGATYTVSLDVEPTANVTITVSSDNGDVTAEPASLTFTPGNWQSGQTVTVSAGEDADKDDELAIVSHGVSGGNYDGVSVGFVTVIVTDDDTTVEALRDFYDATDGGNWTNNANWLSGQPLAEWHGVSVNEDGEVTHLALRDNNLVGTLAPELGKLESLEVLSLDRNGISGELPVELGDLSNLTRLALNRNSLTGAIPSELGGLSNLSIIGLARNQLSGALPASLGNLTGLTRLSLHDNTALSGELPSGFTNLADLQRLAIANTGLCAPDDEAFTAWLDGVADKPGGVATCQ